MPGANHCRRIAAPIRVWSDGVLGLGTLRQAFRDLQVDVDQRVQGGIGHVLDALQDAVGDEGSQLALWSGLGAPDPDGRLGQLEGLFLGEGKNLLIGHGRSSYLAVAGATPILPR
ncbi:MAG: hypothetical protein H7Y60_14535 [Rhodospirillaceae bacterium]|nr:hypothetical protein [Rhodospirillales bacterium]